MKIQFVSQFLINGVVHNEIIYDNPGELILECQSWRPEQLATNISINCVVRDEYSDIVGEAFNGSPEDFIKWLSNEFMHVQAANSELRAKLVEYEGEEEGPEYCDLYDNCGWAGIYEPPV